MINFKFHISGLTIEEQDILLTKIDLILHNVSKPLKEQLDYSLLKHSPNWIRLDVNVSVDKAFTLYRLFKELNFPHKHDDYYHIYEDPVMNLSLEYKRVWEDTE